MRVPYFTLSRPLLAVALVTFGVVSEGCGLRSPYYRGDLTSRAVLEASHDQIDHTLFLIGDAGNPSSQRKEPVLAALQSAASAAPEKSTIVFLGDNIYPSGMPEESSPHRAEAERRLQEQIDVVIESGAWGIFIPGNHDWDQWREKGLESIRRQAAFIDSQRIERLSFMPAPGTPGPHARDIDGRLRLVILDTQWWLQEGEKSMYPHSPSLAGTRGAFLDSLRNLLMDANERAVVVVGHHPLETYGPHGGFFDWKDHLFPLRRLSSWVWLPLPGIGSLYPLARKLGVSSQDLSSSRYRVLREPLEESLAVAPPLVYASGHEHSLQVLEGSAASFYVVSGNGTSAHDSPLTYGSNTLFADPHPGFVKIDLLKDGGIRLAVLQPTGRTGECNETFSMWLKAPETTAGGRRHKPSR